MEDYNKYYIQGSDHYLIPKDEFEELFNEMVNWKEESKKRQEVINKAIEYIKDLYDVRFTDKDKRKLLEILGDKENERKDISI